MGLWLKLRLSFWLSKNTSNRPSDESDAVNGSSLINNIVTSSFIAMATRFASRALVLALLLCSVCGVVVALENSQDSLVVRVSILCVTLLREQTCLVV